jgi:hypothetical protein
VSVAALGFAPAAMAGAAVATDVAPPAFPAPPKLVVIQEGRVTVDAHDAELAAVLSELAQW